MVKGTEGGAFLAYRWCLLASKVNVTVWWLVWIATAGRSLGVGAIQDVGKEIRAVVRGGMLDIDVISRMHRRKSQMVDGLLAGGGGAVVPRP